jgi:hypothetical protein
MSHHEPLLRLLRRGQSDPPEGLVAFTSGIGTTSSDILSGNILRRIKI